MHCGVGEVTVNEAVRKTEFETWVRNICDYLFQQRELALSDSHQWSVGKRKRIQSQNTGRRSKSI